MRLALLTCAIYPDMAEVEKQLWIFLASARKAKIPASDLYLYGLGKNFHHTTWKVKKIDYQLEFLKTELPAEYTHVLYTDAADALIVRGVDEIMAKYHWYGSPLFLASAASFIANVNAGSPEAERYGGMFDERSTIYRYPHNGGYIADRSLLIARLEQMKAIQHWDDSFIWLEALKDGWFKPALDYKCEIFSVGDAPPVVNGRPYVEETRSQPCIIHLTGGHVERTSYKDYKLEPLAKELGII